MDAVASRVYIGDLHGRLWKFITNALSTPILFADLGAGQPIAVPVALPKLPVTTAGVPYVFAESGAESRAYGADSWLAPASGQFRYFGLRDDAPDDDATPPSVADSCPAPPAPVVPPPNGACLWTGEFTTATAAMGGDFRGTAQPATVYQTDLVGRVFFVGTRFVPPPPQSPLSTPVPPFPCQSRFDSIVFALGAETGLAAYDLNASGDDAYVVFDNSRIVGVTMDVDPVAGYSVPRFDEGLNRGGAQPAPAGRKGQRPPLGSDVISATALTGPRVCR